ncbi:MULTISPECIES: ABC transporter permease [unclassified Pseudomonas]|jgi:peptide/nickel transport system permease protein|uniref:ABC transporter permease n=1 Tax=unclassified Pseudomonas TaxID=196821 RepID=UPI000EF06D4D|nr:MULTISPECIES: ABC transporter permease [unclassified Pseudomonas]MCS4246180.1 peptide/nickel transport system permease protein [Pseudomonas sp. BIGb0164]NWE19871.1 ABC transporter permease [Pseudomonas sp. P7548]HCT05933.1 ABC transporter permease [Pseudomonas sp.]
MLTSKKRRPGFVRFLVSHQRWFAFSALVVIVIMAAAAVCAPLFFDWDAVTKINLSRSLVSPGSDFLFGTDQMGRDLLGRVLWGARITLTVALSSVAIAMLIGVAVGAACGYYNGALASLVMRVMDAMIAFPRTLVAILVITVAGNSILSLTLAIAISSIPIYVRFFAGPVAALRNREFVLASKSIGVSDLRLLWVHILPNIGSLVIIQATVSLAEAILIGSGLSFLGLGPPPPTPEWGSMIAESRPLLTTHPYILLAPGCALVLTILSFNIVGDALRDYIDPKSRNA